MLSKFVIDTNVLLVSISERSENHWLFLAFIDEVFTLCVTTSILNEYAEILEQQMGIKTSENVLKIIENAPNVIFIDRYIRWELISVDPDDNKFVDCAIASNAKCVVSQDKHFNVLKKIRFPKVDVVRIDEFKKILLNLS